VRFSFVTLFPELIAPYFDASILKRARDKGLIETVYYNPRDYTKNRHLKVDRAQAGGGAGQVMFAQPLDDLLSHIRHEDLKAHIIFPLPAAKPFRQVDAKRLAKMDHVVFVSGRYEGIDERVIETHADEVFSIGDYVLTGGELPSLVMADAISRNVPGVLGNAESLLNESFEALLLEAPTFTKPNVFKGSPIIKEYLKGNHGKIHALKRELSLQKTKYFRPDLYKQANIKHVEEKK
jgi:tRNA (guanine37-N1)-methyltransferase